MTTRITPAISVATVRPSIPYFWTMPYTMTTNAPVGPPICTRDPPNAETMKPATIAVHRPRPGVTPLAIAKAIASGMATIPTIMPAVRSRVNWRRSYVRSVVTSLGTNMVPPHYRIVGELWIVHGTLLRHPLAAATV